ncbi:unnamed protein product [Vitrella brassicaformis CCMP3155]|uniref:DUF4210 domain-containing protein n=1 Tax=Vitrella brassicaformis (strain CCMP3155) TaxID=1169540 RepID=A0A0G4EXW9_VITBC|nr:unnamed protein product [Vitrella brassicaformis CCMP3155]|eukprot:CEM04159.1 unnamed protein product [Vitrella brassicaformis CCMP3155]
MGSSDVGCVGPARRRRSLVDDWFRNGCPSPLPPSPMSPERTQAPMSLPSARRQMSPFGTDCPRPVASRSHTQEPVDGDVWSGVGNFEEHLLWALMHRRGTRRLPGFRLDLKVREPGDQIKTALSRKLPFDAVLYRVPDPPPLPTSLSSPGIIPHPSHPSLASPWSDRPTPAADADPTAMWASQVPYLAAIDLTQECSFPGLKIPAKGSVQLILQNPEGTPLRWFVVDYDLTDMPKGTHTFVRQRVIEDGREYACQLHIVSPSTNRYYIYGVLRLLFHLRVDNEPNEPSSDTPNIPRATSPPSHPLPTPTAAAPDSPPPARRHHHHHHHHHHNHHHQHYPTSPFRSKRPAAIRLPPAAAKSGVCETSEGDTSTNCCAGYDIERVEDSGGKGKGGVFVGGSGTRVNRRVLYEYPTTRGAGGGGGGRYLAMPRHDVRAMKRMILEKQKNKWGGSHASSTSTSTSAVPSSPCETSPLSSWSPSPCISPPESPSWPLDTFTLPGHAQADTEGPAADGKLTDLSSLCETDSADGESLCSLGPPSPPLSLSCAVDAALSLPDAQIPPLLIDGDTQGQDNVVITMTVQPHVPLHPFATPPPSRPNDPPAALAMRAESEDKVATRWCGEKGRMVRLQKGRSRSFEVETPQSSGEGQQGQGRGRSVCKGTQSVCESCTGGLQKTIMEVTRELQEERGQTDRRS